jgi:hypothetical protein
MRSSEGGWGLEIMRALVDDVHVHGTPYGTTVILRKALSMPGARPARARREPSRRRTERPRLRPRGGLS